MFIEGLNFIESIRPRKIVGLFSSALDGTKYPLLEHEEACKMFKAFIFSIRSNIYNYAPNGWTIVQETRCFVAWRVSSRAFNILTPLFKVIINLNRKGLFVTKSCKN